MFFKLWSLAPLIIMFSFGLTLDKSSVHMSLKASYKNNQFFTYFEMNSIII